MTCVNTFLKMRKIKFLGIVHKRKLQNDDTIVDEEKTLLHRSPKLTSVNTCSLAIVV